MKTNKSFTKRIKVTKNGKLIARKQDRTTSTLDKAVKNDSHVSERSL